MGAAVTLKCVRNLTEKTAFFLGGVPLSVDTVDSRLVPTRRRERLFRVSTEDPREESAHSRALITGVVRFGSGHKGNRVSLWTGRSCQPVCHLIELHVDHALRLIERPDIGVLRQRHCL